MSQKPAELKLLDVFLGYAAEIVAARYRSGIIHRTRDIDTAGNEVEKAVRQVLSRRLPKACHVGHGHIVDYTMNASSQLDIILSDANTVPVLFEAEDGTEYIPYDSVYAVGEVKSTYDSSKKYIERWVEVVTQIKSDLYRPPVAIGPTNVGTSVITLIAPLFSFILFVDSAELTTDELAEELTGLYGGADLGKLPNLVCFLDKGCVFYVGTLPTDSGHPFVNTLEFWPDLAKAGPFASHHRWMFIRSGPDKYRLGTNFAFLYFALMQQISEVRLNRPNIGTYLMRTNIRTDYNGFFLT